MKAFQGPWAGIWNKAGHSWRPLQWVRMISFKSHVGMVIWGQSNDVQRHVQRIFFNYHSLQRCKYFFFPPKKYPQGLLVYCHHPKPLALLRQIHLLHAWLQDWETAETKSGPFLVKNEARPQSRHNYFLWQLVTGSEGNSGGGGRRAFKIIWAMAALL